jgi:hypothetical protein
MMSNKRFVTEWRVPSAKIAADCMKSTNGSSEKKLADGTVQGPPSKVQSRGRRAETATPYQLNLRTRRRPVTGYGAASEDEHEDERK